MYTIARYIQDTKALSNSIVLKINELTTAVNMGVKSNLKYNPKLHEPTKNNKDTWKYYLNIAGKYHPLDTPVKIRVLETEKDEILSNELLNKYPQTRIELQKMDRFYQQLVEEYPNDIRIIHGSMFPVEYEKAVNAKEGSILAYNKDLIEENEYYLIPELEKYIKVLLERWHVKAYSIVDSLYVPALLSYLTASIFLKILELRLSKVNTFQVHSFHLEHFFRSRMDIWDDIKILNKKSIFWLYKNMDVMMHNVGKAMTFEKVYNKLFYMNSIGIGEYTLNRRDPMFNKEYNNLSLPSYIREAPTLVSKQLNDFYLTNNRQSKSVRDILTQQLDNLPDTNKNIPPVFKRYIKEVAEYNLDRFVLEEQKTKVLDIDANKLLKKTGLDLFSLVMDYWIYGLHKDKLYRDKVEYSGNIYSSKRAIKSFTEEELEYQTDDNSILIVTPKVGLLMLLKVLLYSSGNLNLKINSLKYHSVVDTDKNNYQKVLDTKIIKDGVSVPLLKAFQDELPNEPEVFSTIRNFKDYLNNVIDFSKYLWVVMSNTQNFITTNNIKKVFMELNKTDTYKLVDDDNSYTIDELLAMHGVTYNLNQFTDIVKTMKHILKTFTGVALDHEDILISNIEKYRNIIRKLTSYSLHAVGSTSIESELSVYYNNPTVLTMKHGYVITYGANLKGLEAAIGRMKAWSKDMRNWITVDNLNHRPMLTLAKDNWIYGDLVIDKSEIRRDGNDFRYAADLVEIPTYDFGMYKWYNNFLKVKEAELKALEDNKDLKLDSGSLESTRGVKITEVSRQPEIAKYKEDKGHAVLKEGVWLNDFSHYDFRSFPTAWFAPDAKKVLSTFGLDFMAMEDAFLAMDGRSFRITPIQSTLVDQQQPAIGIETEHQGEAVVKNIVTHDSGTLILSKKFEVLDLNRFIHLAKYNKICLVSFAPYTPENDQVTIDHGTLYTYTDREILELYFPKKSPVDNFGIHNTDTRFTLPEVLALVSMPYMVPVKTSEDTTELKMMKISYMGLVDEQGNVDVYDTKSTKTVAIKDMALCPVIRKLANTTGVYLPPVDELTNGMVVLSRNKTQPDEIIDLDIVPEEPKEHTFEDNFHKYGNVYVGKELIEEYKKEPIPIIGNMVPGLDINRTIYKPYSITGNDDYNIYVHSARYIDPKKIPYKSSVKSIRDHMFKYHIVEPDDKGTLHYNFIKINQFYYGLATGLKFDKDIVALSRFVSETDHDVYIRANRPTIALVTPDIPMEGVCILYELDTTKDPHYIETGLTLVNYNKSEMIKLVKNKYKEGTFDLNETIPIYTINNRFNNFRLKEEMETPTKVRLIEEHVGFYEIGSLIYVNLLAHLGLTKRDLKD